MVPQPAHAALLVVDVQEALASLRAENPAVDAFLAACEQVVSLCRDAGVPVIFANDAHRPGLDRELELWGDHGVKGTPGAQTAACLGSDPSDITVPKRRYSAFFQTDLDLTLRELGASSVAVIGFDSNICVLHTLADAYFLGYDTLVVSEATHTSLIGSQEGAEEYWRRCFGSVLLDLGSFKEWLEGRWPA